jgi:hypothetical protein
MPSVCTTDVHSTALLLAPPAAYMAMARDQLDGEDPPLPRDAFGHQACWPYHYAHVHEQRGKGVPLLMVVLWSTSRLYSAPTRAAMESVAGQNRL